MKPKGLTDVGYRNMLIIITAHFFVEYGDRITDRRHTIQDLQCLYSVDYGGCRGMMTKDMGLVLFCYSSFDTKNNRWFFALQTDYNIKNGFIAPKEFPLEEPQYFICFGMSEEFTSIEHMWRLPYYAFSDKKFLSITNTERSLSKRSKFEVTEEFDDFITDFNDKIERVINNAEIKALYGKDGSYELYKFLRDYNE